MPSLKASWTAVLRSATSATRLTDSISAALSTGAVVWCSLGNRLRTLGNSPSSSRVVVRRVPPAAEPSKPMMPSPRAAGGQRDGDLAAGGQRLGGVAEHLAPGTSAASDSSGLCGLPARARGGRAGSGRWRAARSSSPSISIRTPVSTGSMSSRPAAVTAWATAWANTSLGDGAGRGRHVGQRGVVLDRHGLQAEPRRAAGQRDPGAVEGHLDRLGRQAAADVGEQPAADQGLALVGDVGGERGARRGLVVEGREHQARRRWPRSAGRRGPGRSDGPGGCAPPRRRHPRVRRGRRGTSLDGFLRRIEVGRPMRPHGRILE